jgi:hypothetical protein
MTICILLTPYDYQSRMELKRALLAGALREPERRIRGSLTLLVAKCASEDWPEEWPDLMPTLMLPLVHGNQADDQSPAHYRSIHSALVILGGAGIIWSVLSLHVPSRV